MADSANHLGDERFERLALLGEGGMGKVYRAYDTTLERWVALKVLRGDRPEAIPGFLDEARAQARVGHPNVCKVYEVLRDARGATIVMQFVDGTTLDEAAARMDRREKIGVAVAVARAVHAAHKRGLIHRDLKPRNILVERSPDDGGYHPYVADFGIALQAEDAALLQTGQVIGTPQYMSPEQGRGQRGLDARTDIYSLGATFYALFAGRPPFEGTLGEVLPRLLSEDPPRLRRVARGTPRDVETIVMKCLEKTAARRYASARDVAEDLERFLDGEVIRARRPSLVYRARKLLARHRALAVAIAAAACALGVLAVLLVQARARAAERDGLARRFGEEVAEMDKLMRTSHTLPLHDVAREEDRVRARLVALAAEIAEAGELAGGPGAYALGRGALALRDGDAALGHLRRAVALGYSGPEVAQALGHALAWSCRRGDAAACAPAVRALSAGGDDYARGLAALLGGRPAEAIAAGARVFAAQPSFYEAAWLVADGEFAVAGEERRAGRAASADAALGRAGEAYRQALDIGRSDPELRAAACRRSTAAGEPCPGLSSSP